MSFISDIVIINSKFMSKQTNKAISKRMNEAEVLLNRLTELHDSWVNRGCDGSEVKKLTAAMMMVLSQTAFPKNPTQNDIMEFPTRLLNCNAVWEKFVSLHTDTLLYASDLFRKWVWGLYRHHEKTRMDLWKILGWEKFNTDEEEIKDEEDS